MFDGFFIATIVLTFLLAGTVKGVIGLGLPSVSMGVMAAIYDIPTGMALMLVPSLVTNIWQAALGGNAREVLLRIWPFLLMAAATAWIGAMALTRVDLMWLSMLLGGLLISYASVGLFGIRVEIHRRREVWAGPAFGTVNGILTGMTGSFGIPGILYLQAIGLTPDRLVQAMGMLFTVSTLSLAVALQDNRLLSVELGLASAAALIPALLGMALGQRIRKRLPDSLFRKVFFIGLFALGAYIIVAAAFKG